MCIYNCGYVSLIGGRTINILSFIATVTAAFFAMMIYQRLTACKMDRLNMWTVMVLASLAWWNLCDAFFYVAKTKEAAWFWHRIGAPGWCGFIAVTGGFFTVMTGLDQRIKTPLKVLLLIIPLALVLRFMLVSPTAFAEDLVQSTSGLGWTYVQNYRTVWPYLLLTYLAVYMGGSLFYLYLWQREGKSQSTQYLARGFLVLDTLVVAIGFVSIFVLPFFTNLLPPAGCIATLIFGVWYWGWLRDYDFLHVELALNPGKLLESCIDAMVVLDEEYRILYANTEAQRLLDETGRCGDSYLSCLASESRDILISFFRSDESKSSNLDLELSNGIPVIGSITRLSSRKRGLNVCILCMNDISQLKKTQEKLDYLVHYDDLTGLYNRRYLKKKMEEWGNHARESGEDFELLFLDLTRFKQINDTYGHDAGDAALIAVAQALREAVSPEDVLARLAGDEFVVLHRSGDGRDVPALLYHAVQNINSREFAPGITISLDIGVCRFSEAGDINRMISLADIRMYDSKQTSKQ